MSRNATYPKIASMEHLRGLYSTTRLIKSINAGGREGFLGEKNEFYFEHVEFEVPVGILGGYVLKAVLYTDLAVLDKSQADSIIWQSSSYKL